MNGLAPKTGIRDGLPIALGYFAVSIAFGVATVGYGFPVWTPILISLTNFTGSGQALGVQLLASGTATLAELLVAMIAINLRYALMSVSVGQMLERGIGTPRRMLLAFGMTDENFAVAVSRGKEITFGYMLALEITSFVGWIAGTAVGALVGSFLPEIVMVAFRIALPAMFVAIIIPPCRTSRAALFVVLLATALSCAFYYIPGLNTLSKGWVYVICGVTSAVAGALLFPVRDDGKGGSSAEPPAPDNAETPAPDSAARKGGEEDECRPT